MTAPGRFLKKLIACVLLSGGSLLALAPMEARAQLQNNPKLEIPKTLNDTLVKLLKKTPLKKMDAAERAFINQFIIVEAAARHRADLLRPQSDYSRYLDSLQNRVTDYLRLQDSTRNDKIVVFNPLSYDIGKAFYISPETVIATQYVTEEWFWQMRVHSITKVIDAKHISKYGDSTYTPKPVAFAPDFEQIQQTTMMVPMDNDATVVSIPGLTRKQLMHYANAHESWHLRDRTYNIGKIDTAIRFAAKMAHPDFAIYSMPCMQIFIQRQNAEAFADLGALGDMIRKGEDFSVIDAVRQWRSDSAYDIVHMSTLILDGFKARINAIGIDAFRAMEETELEAFYLKTVQDNSMTPTAMSLFLRYKKGDVVAAAFLKPPAPLDQNTPLPQHIRQAIDFNNSISDKPYVRKQDTMSPADLEIKTALDQWDVIRTLTDKAYKADRAITPVSIARAYASLRDELAAAIDKPGQGDLNQAKLIRLRRVFTTEASKIDFVKANLDKKARVAKWLPRRN